MLTRLDLKMPPRLSVATVARIEDALREPTVFITPEYIQQLAVDYHTTIRTIYRHRRRIQANCPVFPRAGGPRLAITWRMEQAIKMLLDKRPWFYQDEITEFLLEAFNIKVS